MEINVNALLSVLKNERKTGELYSLPEDFYKQIESTLKTLVDSSDEKRSMVKLAAQIKDLRTQKLLIYIAYNKEVPHPMPAQEEDLYIQIKKILNKTGAEAKQSRLKITKSIPQIVTPTGNRLGPYEQNQTVYLDDISDIKFMIDNKLGEIVD